MPRTIMMPALSAGMEEGTIGRWLKPIGATIAKGDVLVEIETDKATMEYEAEDDGLLSAILAGDGATVPVNSAIATLLLEGEASTAPAETAGPSAPSPSGAGFAGPPRAEPEVTRTRRAAASPLARRMAAQRGIALEGISDSGARGRVVRIDINRASQTAVAAPPAVVAPPASPPVAQPQPSSHPERQGEGVSPHLYLNARCEVDALLDLCARLNEAGGGTYTLLVNDLAIRAAALALREVPQANVLWLGKLTQLSDNIDILLHGVATVYGAAPILRHADRKGLAALSAEVRALAERARAGTLTPIDCAGGCFTVANLGAYGVESACAPVTPSHGCTLSIGAMERRAVVKGDVCVPATMMRCTLSVDTRAVSGIVGARWLAAFKALIEQPLRLVA